MSLEVFTLQCLNKIIKWLKSQQCSIKKGKESEKKMGVRTLLLLILVLLLHFYMESSQLNRD